MSEEFATMISLVTVFSDAGTPGQNQDDEVCKVPATLGIDETPKMFSEACSASTLDSALPAWLTKTAATSAKLTAIRAKANRH
jgi:hypothetical protein